MQHYVLDISGALNDPSYFTISQKTLNEAGRIRFWCQVDVQIERFNAQELHEPKKEPQQGAEKRNDSYKGEYSRGDADRPRQQQHHFMNHHQQRYNRQQNTKPHYYHPNKVWKPSRY